MPSTSNSSPEAVVSAVRLCVTCLLVEHSLCSPRLLQWQAVLCRRMFHKQISNLMCQAQTGPVLRTIKGDGEYNSTAWVMVQAWRQRCCLQC